MKTEFENSNFSARLRYLYNYYGIDDPDAIPGSELAKMFFGNIEKEALYKKGKILRQHLRPVTKKIDGKTVHVERTADYVSIEYIQKYARTFKCSLDFLTGDSDEPFPTRRNYARHTGLSEKAVARIEELKADPDALQAMNQVFESDFATDLLTQIHYILNLPKYDIMVYDSTGREVNLTDNEMNTVTTLSHPGQTTEPAEPYFTITDRNGNPVTRHRLTRQTLADDSMHRIQDLLFRISSQSVQDAPERFKPYRMDKYPLQ